MVHLFWCELKTDKELELLYVTAGVPKNLNFSQSNFFFHIKIGSLLFITELLVAHVLVKFYFTSLP